MKHIIHIISSLLYCCTVSIYAGSLGEFINQALQNNPSIQAAQSNVDATRARQNAASQPLYNPEINVQHQNALETTTAIGINQTIDWANKRNAREQLGTINILVSQAHLADLRQQLSAAILSALALYKTQQQAVSFAKERSNLLQQFVSLTSKRYESGDIARVDLDLAQLALSEALAQQANIEVNTNQALQILRATTSFSNISWPDLPSALPKLTANIDTDSFMIRLPSILVLNQQYQAARARIEVAERERYPDPTIGIQGGQAMSDGEQKRLIGVSFSIPLFIRNPYKAEVDAANYDAMEAEGKRMNMIRQVKAEIISSAERYQILYNAAEQWQQVSGKPLTDGMTLIERLWQAGEISTTDYIVQLKQRIDSQIAGVELSGRTWQAWAEWLKASGQTESWLGIKHQKQEITG